MELDFGLVELSYAIFDAQMLKVRPEKAGLRCMFLDLDQEPFVHVFSLKTLQLTGTVNTIHILSLEARVWMSRLNNQTPQTIMQRDSARGVNLGVLEVLFFGSAKLCRTVIVMFLR
jgi:hypothetical protein